MIKHTISISQFSRSHILKVKVKQPKKQKKHTWWNLEGLVKTWPLLSQPWTKNMAVVDKARTWILEDDDKHLLLTLDQVPGSRQG